MASTFNGLGIKNPLTNPSNKTNSNTYTQKFFLAGDDTQKLYEIIIDESAQKVILRKGDGAEIELGDLTDIIGYFPTRQEWPQAGLDYTNRSFNDQSGITTSNVSTLALSAQYDLFPQSEYDGIDRGDCWVGITCDQANCYIALENLQDSSGTSLPLSLTGGGIIMCVNRDNGSIKWKKNISEISGVLYDTSRSAPLVDDKYVYFGTNYFAPQTWASTVGGSDTTVYNIFTGATQVGRGAPASLCKINKFTGEKIAICNIGNAAQKIDDLDNFLTITQSPIFVEKSGFKYIAIGTSSVQSFIAGLHSRSPATIFGGATPILDNQYRMTEMGRLCIIDPETMNIIKTIDSGPPIYSAGFTMDNSLSVDNGGGYLRPAQTQMKIRHYVATSDIAALGPIGTGGVLDASTTGPNGEDQWIGAQQITWFFEQQDGSNFIPGPLHRQVVRDKNNQVISLAGALPISAITTANPTQLTFVQPHPWTAQDANAVNGLYVQVQQNTDIPDGAYRIVNFIDANNIEIGFDNTAGAGVADGCVWSPALVIASVAIVNPTTATITVGTDHRCVVGDTVSISGRTDIPDGRYAVANPTALTFDITVDTTGVVVTGGGRVVLLDRGGANLQRDAVIESQLNYCVFHINTALVSGSLNFTVTGPTNTSYVFALNDLCVNLAGTYQGETGLYGIPTARMQKYIQDGDVLDDQDAYESSYHGASVWGSSSSLIKDSNGDVVEIVINNGQAHHIPLDEMESIALSSTSPGLLAQENTIFAADVTFTGAPTTPNLTAYRAAVGSRATNSYADIQVAKSPRGNRFYFDAVFAIDFRAGSVGNILWSHRMQGYDTWHIGFSLFSLRSLVPPAAFNVYVDVPSYTVFPVFQWVDCQAYYDVVRGADGDFGEGTYLIGSDLNNLRIGLVTKGALNSALSLTNPDLGPTSITPINGFSGTSFVVAGASSLLGGSNLGSCADNSHVYSCQLNAQSYSTFNLTYQTQPRGTFTSGLPQNHPPQNRWYPVNVTDPNTIVPFQQQQSYLSAFNVTTGAITWETGATPGDTAPFAASLSCPSNSASHVFICDGSGKLQVFLKSNGSHVKTLDVESGGLSRPVLVGNEVFAVTGRQFYAATFNTGVNSQTGSSYKGGKYLFKFSVV